MEKVNTKTIVQNRKAYHDYYVEETFEAGIELCGTEVKSLRQGRVNLKDAWCSVDNGEMILKGVHISPYEQGNIFNRDPLRPKKLLMHKSEIMKLFGKTREKGFTLVPLRVYFKRGRAKMEIALASGKHTFDKRRTLADKAMKRDVERELKERQRD